MSKNIVVGLGNNLDYEAFWDVQIFQKLIDQFQIRKNDFAIHPIIQTQRDLVCSILYFLSRNEGGERYVEDMQVLDQFCSFFAGKYTLGGTGARATLALAQRGACCTVHLVFVNDRVLSLLPRNCNYLCEPTAFDSSPHLIIQYPQNVILSGADFRICTNCSNRLIYLHDECNQMLPLSPKLPDALRDADILLLSGFNAIQDKMILRQRLDALVAMMKNLPEHATVILEEADYPIPTFREQVQAALLPHVTLYSMNEDEWQSIIGRSVSLLDEKDVFNAVETLRKSVIGYEGALMIHTQGWVLVAGSTAKELHEAVYQGMLTASTRYRCGDIFSLTDLEQTSLMPLQKLSFYFSKKLEMLFKGRGICVPAWDLSSVTHATTIGLGDAFIGGLLTGLNGFSYPAITKENTLC